MKAFFSGCRCGSSDARLPLWEQRWDCTLDVWIRLERKRRAGYVFWGPRRWRWPDFLPTTGCRWKNFCGRYSKAGCCAPGPACSGRKTIGIYSFVKKGGWKNQPPQPVEKPALAIRPEQVFCLKTRRQEEKAVKCQAHFRAIWTVCRHPVPDGGHSISRWPAFSDSWQQI